MHAKEPMHRVFLVALLTGLVCSAIIASVTVTLRPIQDVNRLHYMQANILQAAGLLRSDIALDDQLNQLETRLVALDTGDFMTTIDPATYDQRQAANDPEQSIALSPSQDIAGIKRRAKYAPVYLHRDDAGSIDTIILPIHGYGLWSTLYGFIALQGDTSSVIGVRFYEHQETPGLGGEVDNPRWLQQWRGKAVYDAWWRPAIQLVKGGVNEQTPQALHKVDALSGATLTNRGIENMLKFWLGEAGFGPFLAKVRDSGRSHKE
jgi:Na+-transporting NADH:ubiquinone oxidoreductase subunit C